MLEAARQATDVFEDTQARLHGRPSSRGRAGGVPAATCYMGDMGDPTGSRAPRSEARGHPGPEGMQTIRWQLVRPTTRACTAPYGQPGQARRVAGQHHRRGSLGAQGPETRGWWRFVCQSSCETHRGRGSRNPRVVVEEAAAQVVGRSRLRPAPANQRPAAVGGPSGGSLIGMGTGRGLQGAGAGGPRVCSRASRCCCWCWCLSLGGGSWVWLVWVWTGAGVGVALSGS